MKLLVIFTIVLSMASIQIGCENSGTETGNPTVGASPGFIDDISAPTLFITDLVSTSCSIIRKCHNIEAAECNTEWFTLADVDTEIGLNMGDYPTLEETLSAENDEVIIPGSDAKTDCLADINALSCFGSGVEQAYDPLAGNPFEMGAGMIPASCQTVFSP